MLSPNRKLTLEGVLAAGKDPYHYTYVIPCRDRRLVELWEKIFSPDFTFPSLKFGLAACWVGVIGLCFVGMSCDAWGLTIIALGIKISLLIWVGLMASLFGPVYLLTLHPVIASVSIPIMLAAVIAVVTAAYMYMRQPTQLKLGPLGIEVKYGFQKYGTYTGVLWENIRAVDLLQTQATNPDDWLIVFKGDGNEQLRLRNGTLLTSDDRAELLNAVQSHAPEATINPELLHLLTPVATSSYTELWLQSLASPPKRARLTPLEPGMELAGGRYRIENIVAAGGQGVVYAATDCHSAMSGGSQNVVVKEIILPIFGDDNTRQKELERFAQEAQLLQKLHHPQIVRLFDFFVEDHRGYLVLESIKGTSLSELVSKEGAQSEAKVVELGLKMCDILRYLHTLTPPLVHRDFTPDNLILVADGKLKLIDFNVACEMNYTTTATVVGKRAYLPPEQFRGKPTTQSDIYALGCTLFFLLTGEEPEPISSSHPIQIRPDIDETLDAIIAGATQPNLAKRSTDIVAVKTELARLRGRKPNLE